MLWGPGSLGAVNTFSAAQSGLALSGASRGVGWVFSVPQDGTISQVGFLTTGKAGTPVAHAVGVYTVDSSGRPTTTAYGGSTAGAITPTAASGWTWVTLGANATANAGDWASVQIYPTGAADISNYIQVAYEAIGNLGGVSMYNNSGWLPNGVGTSALAIKYATSGTVYGLALASATVHVQLRSNTTPDEAGCVFTLPADMTCYGAKIHAHAAGWGSSAAVDVVLYNGAGTAIATSSITDKDFVDDVAPINVYWDAVSLTASTTYRLVVKPTVGTNGDVYIPKWTFDAAGSMAALPCGDAWQYTSRTDAGSWTDDSVSICPFGIWVSAMTLTSVTNIISSKFVVAV